MLCKYYVLPYFTLRLPKRVKFVHWHRIVWISWAPNLESNQAFELDEWMYTFLVAKELKFVHWHWIKINITGTQFGIQLSLWIGWMNVHILGCQRVKVCALTLDRDEYHRHPIWNQIKPFELDEWMNVHILGSEVGKKENGLKTIFLGSKIGRFYYLKDHVWVRFWFSVLIPNYELIWWK